MTPAAYRAVQEEDPALAEALVLAEITAHRMQVPITDPAFDADDEQGVAYLAAIRACRSWRKEGGASLRTWIITSARCAILENRRVQDFLTRADRKAEGERRDALEAAQDPDERRRLAYAREPFARPIASLEEVILDQEDPERSAIEQPPVVWDNLEATTTVADLAAPFAALPERTRTVLRLVFWQRLDYETVGRTVGVSTSRVQQIISQAYRRLRPQLPGYFEGEERRAKSEGPDYTAWWAITDAELLARRSRGESIGRLAQSLGVSRSSVERRLRQIRKQGEGAPGTESDSATSQPTSEEAEAPGSAPWRVVGHRGDGEEER